jgi:hypothetical protein
MLAGILAEPMKDQLNASLSNLLLAFIPDKYATIVQYALFLLIPVTISYSAECLAI